MKGIMSIKSIFFDKTYFTKIYNANIYNDVVKNQNQFKCNCS